jgi:hypothetical protein
VIYEVGINSITFPEKVKHILFYCIEWRSINE